MLEEDEELLTIPFSYLNAYAYCPRRFYYEFVLGEMEVNEHVLKGQLLHERIDQPGSETRGEKVQLRRVYLCAPRLGLVGYGDLIELAERDADLTTLARSGKISPVEYKKGKMGKWISDHTQLCAQALALEEVLELPEGCITHGFLYYFESARRDEVPLENDLRQRTKNLLSEARQVARQRVPPPPIRNRHKCRDCSLEPQCLPRETLTFYTRNGEKKDGDSLFD